MGVGHGVAVLPVALGQRPVDDAREDVGGAVDHGKVEEGGGNGKDGRKEKEDQIAHPELNVWLKI